MPLSFQPACLPVAQNGLPHVSSSHALGLMMTTMSIIPTWPSLPQRSFLERPYAQSAAGFPGLVIDSETEQVYVDRAIMEKEIDRLSLAYLKNNMSLAAFTSDNAAGLMELLRMPSGWFEGRAIRSQIMGPISLGVYLTDDQQRPLVYDPMLLEAIAHLLSLRAGWLSRQFPEEMVRDTIICLDEPFLDAFLSPYFPIDWERGLELLQIVFRAMGGCRGIVLGNVGTWWSRERGSAVYWEPVLDTSVELLKFDVYYHSEMMLNAAQILPAFLNRPGLVTWGLIPSNAESLAQESPTTLVARFNAILRRLTEAGVDRDQILQASFISTSGNLSLLSIEVAEQALKMCIEVSSRLRTTYTLGEEKH